MRATFSAKNRDAESLQVKVKIMWTYPQIFTGRRVVRATGTRNIELTGIRSLA